MMPIQHLAARIKDQPVLTGLIRLRGGCARMGALVPAFVQILLSGVPQPMRTDADAAIDGTLSSSVADRPDKPPFAASGGAPTASSGDGVRPARWPLAIGSTWWRNDDGAILTIEGPADEHPYLAVRVSMPGRPDTRGDVHPAVMTAAIMESLLPYIVDDR